jgi:putative ABC transport system permease protein
MSKSPKTFSRRLACTLIQRWVSRAYIEEFLGDLDEIYEDRLAARGKFIAEAMYWVDVIHLRLLVNRK